MEQTTTGNNLVKTITGTIPEDLSSFKEPEIAGEGGGVFKWIIIFILIMALLGVNIFIYLAKGTQSFSDFISPYLEMIGITALKTTTQIADVSKKGLENVLVPELKRTTDDKLSNANDNLGKVGSTGEKCSNPSRDKIMQALDNAAQTENYLADEASSNIQHSGKSKWCFVGDEKGTRNCVQVEESQKCMSGDIFPSRDICINPKIRS